MFEIEKNEIIKTGIKLDKYGLIALAGGNISLRIDNEHILVTPSGMIYDEMVTDDVLVMDIEGNIVEGDRKPSVDTAALLYIYKKLPEINSVIHTHQPYATAIGLVKDELECNVTTLANATGGSVPVAPYGTAASEDMGVKAAQYLGDKTAVILRNHGVIGVGKDLKKALYSCVYLEEAAKTIAIAESMGGVVYKLDPEEARKATEGFKTYGQDK